jgi:hypothetical protein
MGGIMSVKKMLFTLCVMVLVGMMAAPAVATEVVPAYYAGNPTCGDIGYSEGYEFDPPVVGTSPDGAVTITDIYRVDENEYFDWSAVGVHVQAVIVKGGPNADAYVYCPQVVMSDTGLHAPVNPSNGIFYGLSHVDFCFNPPINTPEFPTAALPMMMIIGLLGAILVLKR